MNWGYAMKKSSMIKNGRIVFMAFLAAALLLGLTACPHDDGGNGGGKKPTFPDKAELLSLTLGGNGSEVEGLGTPADTLADFLDVDDEDDVDKPKPGNATVFTKTDMSVTCQAESSGASVSWAVVADLAAVASFNDSALHRNHVNFANGRYLIIRIVSYNKNATLYYVIHVDVVIVRLSSVTVGGQALNSAALPQPASREDWAEPIQLLFDGPAGAITIANALADTSVEVKGDVTWAVVTQDQLDHILQLEEYDSVIDYGTEESLVFKDTENLVVKVEDPATDHPTSSAYYRIIINFKKKITVGYIGNYNQGQGIAIADGVLDKRWTNSTDFDDKWDWKNDETDTFPIRKVFLGDGNPGIAYLREPTTFGNARLLWDEKGLYVYVDVTDPDITPTSSSVDIFINENYDNYKEGNYTVMGGHYRIGADGARSGDPVAAVDAFNTLNKTAVWAKPDDSGYIVTAYVPWRFHHVYELESGKKIGIDLQINAYGEAGTRRATMVWNNVADTNYQNVSHYAEATLLIPSGVTLKQDALAPVFSVHPASGWYLAGSINGTLEARATVTDSGDVKGVWYKSNSWTGEGEAVSTPNNLPDILHLNALDTPLTVGTYYFYMKATNSNPNAQGDIKEKTAESARARIQIFANNAAVVEQLTLQNSYAIYFFDDVDLISSDTTWGDYSLISVDYKVDAANLAKAPASFRLMGNYEARDFIGSGDRHTVAPWETYNLRYIYDDLGAGNAFTDATANTWFTRIYRLGNKNEITGEKYGPDNTPPPEFNDGGAGQVKPFSDALGPFYFGIGIPGGNAPIVQQVRNVKLIHKDNIVMDRTGEGTVEDPYVYTYSGLKTSGYDSTKDIVSKGSGLPGLAFTCNDDNNLINSDRNFAAE
jgi:hypothetical protein